MMFSQMQGGPPYLDEETSKKVGWVNSDVLMNNYD